MKRFLSVFLAVVMLFGMVAIAPFGAMEAEAVGVGSILIFHYHRDDGNYDDWDMWIWPKGGEGTANAFTEEDSFGKIVIYELPVESSEVGFIVRQGGDSWAAKDVGEDQFVLPTGDVNEYWIYSGVAGALTEAPEGYSAYNAEEQAAELAKAKAEAEAAVLANTQEASENFANGEGQLVTIHYHRFLEEYDGWDLWITTDTDSEGKGYNFTGTDEYGPYAQLGLTGDFSKLYIQLRKGGYDWTETDSIAKTVEANGEAKEIWLIEKDASVYYTREEADISPKFLNATIVSLTKGTFELTVPYESAEALESAIVITDSEGNAVDFTVNCGSEVAGTITFAQSAELSKNYTISLEGYGDYVMNISGSKTIFESPEFEAAYTYNGNDLGANYSADSTFFRLWAPTSSEVYVNLYKDGVEGDAYEVWPLTRAENGTWTATVEGDLNGVYYTYSVHVNGVINEAVDPYARSTGANGNRGMIIDLDSTDPDGWDKVTRPDYGDSYTDAIIYEMHIKDLTNNESSGVSEANRGKYLGVTELGTTTTDGVATGLSHIVDLGVTHVQIQPMYDYQSVDELGSADQFNWGYDPQNYNVPEGSYSSDATDGFVRVREMKAMIKALHENGLRVNMDVVYNHTFNTNSCLNKIVPGYYYRTDNNGNFTNGSGCGNETASERSMVRKYIVDSVVYWATEYQIDGYRFDLMGVHDIETMSAVRAALDEIDPSIMVYGEGWTGGSSALASSQAALKANVGKIEGIVGAFSDDIRDGAKGSVFDSADTGFATGSSKITRLADVKFGIAAGVEHPQTDTSLLNSSSNYWAPTPSHFISYVECHDNLTLWDKVKLSRPDASEEDQIKMDKLAATISLTGQGVHFMQLGQDFLRSKNGDSNSYSSSNAVNNVKWDTKSANMDVYNYYKGLIELHKSYEGFNLDSAEAIAECLVFDANTPLNVVAFTLNKSETYGVDYSAIVIHNAGTEPYTFTLPEGTWDIYANGEKAGTEALESVSGTVTVPGITSFVIMEPHSDVKALLGGAALGTMTVGGFSIFALAVVLLAAAAYVVAFILAKKAASGKAEKCECKEECCCAAEEAVVEETPAEEAAVEETAAEETVEEAVEEVPVEEAPVEEAPVEEVPETTSEESVEEAAPAEVIAEEAPAAEETTEE